jgi:DNA invertase Pin-like site-specific DNA recombinase
MESNQPSQTRTIGYARVSTEEQDLTLQLNALRKDGCDQIIEEKASGGSMERDGLRKLRRALRRGDTLVIWKLDRLGRSVKGLLNWLDWMKDEGIELRVLTEQIDTTTPSGRMVTTVMAALAQMERELTAERTRSGMEAKRAAGHTFGRRHSIMAFPERLKVMQDFFDAGGDLFNLRPEDALRMLNEDAYEGVPKRKRPPAITSHETFRRWRRERFPGLIRPDELEGK